MNNLAALDAGGLYALGVTGDDGEGYELRKCLGRLGCLTEGLVSVPGLMTPTYLKPRNCRVADLSGEHERYDTKNRRATPAEAQDKVLAYLESILPRIDAVAVQDQVEAEEEEDSGVVTRRVKERLADLAGRFPDKVFWVDSRARIGAFRHVMIKVNAREAVRQVFPPGDESPDDKTVVLAAAELRRRTGRPVFVTAGGRGMWVSDPEPALVRAVAVPEPTDPTGAGDSATAGAVLALCSGASPREAALVANLVASITVQQLAVTGTAGRGELGPRLEMWRAQAERRNPK
jgi:sugar/nucleoside kinase (ribokinase family)